LDDKMSLYAEYLTERTNDEILETEEGFITWRYLNEAQVYIVDLYVKPEYREKKYATSLAAAVIDEAKKKGCTEMLGTVVPSAKGSHTSLKVLIFYGMTLKSASNDLIIMRKEL
jgi:GNAT superfamily N-acetyltransferase